MFESINYAAFQINFKGNLSGFIYFHTDKKASNILTLFAYLIYSYTFIFYTFCSASPI